MKISADLDGGTGEESDTGNQARLVVAVDGPSGAGKSSASRGAAIALGVRYLDTGSMYRALTWWLLERGVAVSDVGLVGELAAEPVIEVGTDPRAPWTRVDGTDVSAAIRTREVTSAVSAVAAVPRVRTRLIAQQRDIIAKADGIVAEGRDIGTVVAPEAGLKVFLTASPEERARRRAAELGADQATVLAEQTVRDERDSTREHSPLRPAPGAVTLDTTGLSVEEVVGRIAALARVA